MFWKKKKSRLELLREAAIDRAHDAFETAQELLQHASGAVHQTLDHAPEKLEDLKAGATGTLGGAVTRVGGAVSALGSVAGTAADAAKKGAHQRATHAGEFAHERVEDARHLLDEKRHHLEKRFAKKQRRAVEAKQALQEAAQKKIENVRAPELVVTEDYQKWVWLGVGVLIGAVVGILLAPSSGRRNRAAVRDKLSKGAHKAEDLGEAAARKARDLGNRAEGVAHKISETVQTKIGGESDEADDVVIADRVRSALGRLPEAQSLERINVDSSDGTVTLRGPIVDSSTREALLAATRGVAGVREVVSELLIEDDSEETFVG